jgi:hypothetical protein
MYIYIKINMELPLWARKCWEFLVRGCCNHFAVTAHKGPCVFYGLAGLSLCVCVCIYAYIYKMKLGLAAVGAQVQRSSRAL